jgi:putative transcriptional regulator
MPSRKIKNNIKDLRLQNQRMSQALLAEKVNLSRQTISAIESGKNTPNLLIAMQLAEVFDKKIEEVFFWSNQKKVE